MSFLEANRGETHEESYWRPEVINLDKKNKRALVQFVGYKDVDNAKQGLAVVGSKKYDLFGSKFDDYFALDEISGENKDVYKQAYKLSMDILDKDSGEKTEPIKNDDDVVVVEGQPIMVSFFDGAKED